MLSRRSRLRLLSSDKPGYSEPSKLACWERLGSCFGLFEIGRSVCT